MVLAPTAITLDTIMTLVAVSPSLMLLLLSRSVVMLLAVGRDEGVVALQAPFDSGDDGRPDAEMLGHRGEGDVLALNPGFGTPDALATRNGGAAHAVTSGAARISPKCSRRTHPSPAKLPKTACQLRFPRYVSGPGPTRAGERRSFQ